MPEQYALFFTIASSEAGSERIFWNSPAKLVPTIKDSKNSYGIQQIFYYLDMCVCTLPLEDSDINTPEIKKRIKSILPDDVVDPKDPNFEFLWSVIPVDELKEINEEMNEEPLPIIKNLKEGAAGGGSRGG